MTENGPIWFYISLILGMIAGYMLALIVHGNRIWPRRHRRLPLTIAAAIRALKDKP